MLARSYQPFSTFDPRSIPGITLWFDAADADSFSYSTGTTINQWRDKSGNANHMVVYSGQTAPTRTIDVGRNAVLFAEGNALRTTNSISFATLTSTIFVVARLISVNSGILGMLLSFADDGGGDYSIRYSGVNVLLNGDNNDIGLNRYFVNGVFLAGGANPAAPYTSYHIISTAANSTRTGNSRVSLSHPFGSRFFIGAVSEVLIFSNNEFTRQNRQTVEGYLAWKWNLPSVLSFAHPSRSFPLLTRPFSPLDLDRCAMWLDAADRSTINFGSGVNVTSWLDKSPNSLTATSFVLGNRTITYNTTGGYNSVFINNGSSVLITPGQYAFLSLSANIQEQADFTIFAVINFNSIANQTLQTIYSNRRIESADVRAPIFSAGELIEVVLPLNSPSIQVNYTNPYGNRCIIVGRSSLTHLAAFVNGNDSASLPRSNTRYAIDQSDTPTIGGTYKVGENAFVDHRFTTGAFHELILYNSALSVLDRQRVEGYLSQKWEIPSFLSTQPFALFRAIPTSTLFVPTSLANCALWLDGMDRGNMSFSGTTITTWNDKSGNGRNATGVGTPTLDPKGGVIFNGSSCFQNTSTAINLSQRSIFFVFRQTVYTRNNGIISFIPNPSSSNDWSALSGISIESEITSGGVIHFVGNSTNHYPSTALGSQSDVGNDQIYNDNVAGTVTTFRYNGGPLITRNLSYLPTTSSGYLIGGRWSGGLFNGSRQNGVISEVIIYSSPLSFRQSQQVEGYLAAKWGLIGRIPARHPFRAIPPSYGLLADPIIIQPDIIQYSVFTSNGTFVPPSSNLTINYLIVGGGGGGGDRHGGGGGAGGIVSGTTVISSAVTITVGAAGQYGATTEGGQQQFGSPSGAGSKGGDSSIAGVATAFGGGGGGTFDGNPSQGSVGSGGGGGGNSLAGVAGTSGQGFSGGNGGQPAGGGGGGAGGAGSNANTSTGGIGVSTFSQQLLAVGYGTTFATSPNNPISGGVAFIAGGGGGAADSPNSPTVRNGGTGGGGRGDWDDSFITAGTPNTGGGGGASRSNNSGTTGRNGGSGLVLIWYSGSNPNIIAPSNTITTSDLVLHLDAGNTASYPRSGTTWTSIGSNTMNFTLTNTTYSSDNGGYLLFNPASNSRGYSSSNLSLMTTFTCECWIFVTGQTGGAPAIFADAYPGTTARINIAMNSYGSSTMVIGHFNGGWNTSGNASYNLNQWVHLTGTFTGSAFLFYVNGVLTINTPSSAVPQANGGGTFIMKRWDSDDFIGGRLAVLRIYSRAISQSEVTQNYNTQIGRFETQTILSERTFNGYITNSFELLPNTEGVLVQNISLKDVFMGPTPQLPGRLPAIAYPLMNPGEYICVVLDGGWEKTVHLQIVSDSAGLFFRGAIAYFRAIGSSPPFSTTDTNTNESIIPSMDTSLPLSTGPQERGYAVTGFTIVF